MPTINGRACVVNGVPVDKVFSDGRQVYGRNMLTGTSNQETSGTIPANNWNIPSQRRFISVTAGQKFSYQIFITNDNTIDLSVTANAYSGNTLNAQYVGNVIKAGTSGYSSVTFTIPSGAGKLNVSGASVLVRPSSDTTVHWQEEKLELGTIVTPWAPAPEDVM